MNEAVNDSAKLMAQVLEILKRDSKNSEDIHTGVNESIPLLEQALDKLLNCK